jgi:hypothetical protein
MANLLKLLQQGFFIGTKKGILAIIKNSETKPIDEIQWLGSNILIQIKTRLFYWMHLIKRVKPQSIKV